MSVGKIRQFAAEMQTADRNKIVFVFFLVVVALILSAGIVSKSYVYMFILFCLAFFLYLFIKQFEAFVLLMLVINHEFFYLIPKEVLGKYRYQGFLYIILPVICVWYLFSKKKHYAINFKYFVLSFILLIIGGALNSHIQGQPLWLSLKAEIGYFLILYYFVFLVKNVDIKKFFKLISIAGVFLCAVNNIQYVFFRNYQFIHYLREFERVGRLRFMVGDYFLFFSSIVVFCEFLRRRKGIHLLVFIYMALTIILQMQIRATIWGFLVTVLSLLYIAKRINIIKATIIGIAFLALLVFIAPLFRSTFIGELFELTKYEILEGRGNVGPRYIALDYYYKEIKKSPIIGRGIWNLDFKDPISPDHLENKGIYLGDIGLVSLLFHFGLIGVIWLILLFAKIYRVTFFSFGRLKNDINLAPIGYLIFSIATMPTLNCFIMGENTIYLALILAILTQSIILDKEPESLINDERDPSRTSLPRDRS